ncbi:ileal sodium/bile acid cotransporter-like isoform X2 [Anthonomus grandis grandis]|uniref:ileal sodium/bile acid cotransporter-like isoform X2 n=1 Tax=Anthonomus grandis grandis TaxID=2921223 RepID=UPI002165A009|nr:ileal sodium/bile acid cotransporter-like isoform X2 [Anthonomus grandis grandis]
MRMCPISGFLQSLIVIFTLLLVCHAVLVKSYLSITFNPKNVTLFMYDNVTVEYNVTNTDGLTECVLYSENLHVAFIEKEIVLRHPNQTGSFNLTGNFLGQTVISCKNKLTNEKASENHLKVKCLRKQRLIDRIFTGSTATLVAIIYINFGCVVQWAELKNLIKKPVGPVIGFCGQFIVMPLLSYIIGYLLFPNDPAMRLGMFFTGVSPAGGASNIWTAILDGNIDLSILMTTISTIAAFGMMPVWLFTLGRTIFTDAHLEVPYGHISSYVFALVVPLTIGYLINRYLKKTGAFLGRILKGFSSLLILFIIIFAIVTNLYLFELFSWRIVVAGMGLPWLGYLLGYILAKIFKQPAPDALAIAIETGIQNTGIAIFLLRFALEPLHADLTTVAPVSVAIMTPFPLTVIYLYKKLRAREINFVPRFAPPYQKTDGTDLCPRRQSSLSQTYRQTTGKQDSAVACLS